ncbi:MAG: TrmB family transcriptional regulator [Haloferacaceae archaeon]
MADVDLEQVERESARLLQKLGLTEYEAYTFVYLTRLGTGTAKDVADMDHVPRTRVYDAVDTLHDAGLVDVQYTSPRRFTPVSRETAVRKLELERQNVITELSELLAQLEPVERSTEEFAVWTVTGREAVTSRIIEYVAEAESEVVYMTVDELLTDDHLDALGAASERGVGIHLAGISEAVQERVQDRVPSAELFETLWEWSEAGAGSLLVVDRQTALVSVLVDGETAESFDEVAIWGTGDHNSLVVVLRAIFTWRLGDESVTNGGRPSSNGDRTDGGRPGADGSRPDGGEPSDDGALDRDDQTLDPA